MLCAGGMIWLPSFLHFCFFVSLLPNHCAKTWGAVLKQVWEPIPCLLSDCSRAYFTVSLWYSAGCGFAMHSLMLRYDPSAPGLPMSYFERTFDFITYFFCIDWEMVMRFLGPSSCWWTISHLSICIDWAVLASWDDSAWSCPSRGCAGQYEKSLVLHVSTEALLSLMETFPLLPWVLAFCWCLVSYCMSQKLPKAFWV